MIQRRSGRASPARATRVVSPRKRHDGASSGFAGGCAGMRRLASRPAVALSSSTAGTQRAVAASAIRMPLLKVPSRMAANVPAATRALPASNAPAGSRFGRMAYLTGPNSADCTPVRNSARNSSSREAVAKPTQTSAISSTSANLTPRMSRWRARRSAKSPPVAENRKNGRMKTPAEAATSVPVLRPAASASWKVIRKTSALRKKLSL